METEKLKELLKEHVKQQKTTTGISDLLTENRSMPFQILK
jgi:hypothetical protein